MRIAEADYKVLMKSRRDWRSKLGRNSLGDSELAFVAVGMDGELPVYRYRERKLKLPSHFDSNQLVAILQSFPDVASLWLGEVESLSLSACKAIGEANIRTLELPGSRIHLTDEMTEALARCPLQRLDFGGCTFTEAGFQEIEKITTLEHVTVAGPLPPRSLVSLSKLPKFVALCIEAKGSIDVADAVERVDQETLNSVKRLNGRPFRLSIDCGGRMHPELIRAFLRVESMKGLYLNTGDLIDLGPTDYEACKKMRQLEQFVVPHEEDSQSLEAIREDIKYRAEQRNKSR